MVSDATRLGAGSTELFPNGFVEGNQQPLPTLSLELARVALVLLPPKPLGVAAKELAQKAATLRTKAPKVPPPRDKGEACLVAKGQGLLFAASSSASCDL